MTNYADSVEAAKKFLGEDKCQMCGGEDAIGYLIAGTGEAVRACKSCGEEGIKKGDIWGEWWVDSKGGKAEPVSDKDEVIDLEELPMEGPTDADMDAAIEIMKRGSTEGLTKYQAACIIARHLQDERDAIVEYIEILVCGGEEDTNVELGNAFVLLPDWLTEKLSDLFGTAVPGGK